MFLTLEKYRSMQRYDNARTRLGRIVGFVYIARVNGISWGSTVNITTRALVGAFRAMTDPHRTIHPRV